MFIQENVKVIIEIYIIKNGIRKYRENKEKKKDI